MIFTWIKSCNYRFSYKGFSPKENNIKGWVTIKMNWETYANFCINLLSIFNEAEDFLKKKQFSASRFLGCSCFLGAPELLSSEALGEMEAPVPSSVFFFPFSRVSHAFKMTIVFSISSAEEGCSACDAEAYLTQGHMCFV